MNFSETTTLFEQEYLIKGPAGAIHVVEHGEGGLPVVFLHAFGGSANHWSSQLSHLRENRRVIALDFRGHGKSETPADGNYAASALAEDISAVVDNLELDHFVLVGHSMGGVAAIEYAGLHAEKVVGLVLTGTPGKTPPDQYNPIIQSLESGTYQQVMDQYMKGLLKNAKPDVVVEVTREFKAMSKDTSISIIKSMFQFDPIPSLKKYKGRKLIISSAQENQQANTLDHLFPNIRHKTIEGTSHWTHLDRSGQFNKILDEFLLRLDSENLVNAELFL